MEDNNKDLENTELECDENEASSDDKLDMKSGKAPSVLETLRKINEKERREELEAESRRTEMIANAERAKREKYAQKLAQDRIELMKLKQGVISEEDIPKEEKIEKEYSTVEKIGNFFYHNKMYIVIITLIAAVAAFLLYDIITQKHPDVSVMIIADDSEFYFRTEDIQKLFEPYCRDCNGDGVVYVRASYLPAVVDNSDPSALYYAQADQTKLVAEFQSETSIIVIADEYTCDVVKISDGVLKDMREVYPDDENAAKLGYMLKGTNFAEDIKYSALSEELFIGFRVPTEGLIVDEEEFTENYNNAIEMWNNSINGNAVSADAVLYTSEKQKD